MDCTQYREALSARLDCEPTLLADQILEAHLSSCRGCASWLRAAEQVTRRIRVAPAELVPDHTRQILAALPRSDATGRGTGRGVGRRRGVRRPQPLWLLVALARAMLAALGTAQAFLAYPFLVLGHDSMDAPMHVAHETGAWNAALAVAFLWVALRPRSASGLLPMLSAFVAILLLVSLPDLASGHVHGGRVLTHLLTAAGLGLLTFLAWRHPRPGRPLLGARGGQGGASWAAPGGDAAPASALSDWAGRRSRPGPATGATEATEERTPRLVPGLVPGLESGLESGLAADATSGLARGSDVRGNVA